MPTRAHVAAASLLALLASCPVATEAAPTTVQLVWQPRTTAGVQRYLAYTRRAGGPWSVGIDLGLPVAATDGSLSGDVPIADRTTEWAFCVTAVASDGRESTRSNEIVLPALPPASTTSTTTSSSSSTTSTSRPRSVPTTIRTTTSTSSTSTSSSRPLATTTSTTLARPTALSTTSTTTTPPRPATTTSTTRPRPTTTSTTHPPPATTLPVSSTTTQTATSTTSSPASTTTSTEPEGCPGAACPASDPCAGAVGLDRLAVTRFTVRAVGWSPWQWTASASFAATGPVDPGATGAGLTLVRPDGAGIFDAWIPGWAFAVDARRTRFTFRARGTRARVPGTNGVRRLALTLRRGRIGVVVAARGNQIEPAAGQRVLGWQLRLGDACPREPALLCSLDGPDSKRCR